MFYFNLIQLFVYNLPDCLSSCPMFSDLNHYFGEYNVNIIGQKPQK